MMNLYMVIAHNATVIISKLCDFCLILSLYLHMYLEYGKVTFLCSVFSLQCNADNSHTEQPSSLHKYTLFMSITK
jgi:hypothetical protein